MSPSKLWQYCSVPSCGKDGEPEGLWSYTMSPSKRWEYCNVPSCGKDGEPEGLWCYTMSPSTRWEYCNVPSCGKDGEPEGPCVILCLPPNGGSIAMSRHVVRIVLPEGEPKANIECLPTSYNVPTCGKADFPRWGTIGATKIISPRT